VEWLKVKALNSNPNTRKENGGGEGIKENSKGCEFNYDIL
jgi:hypothetical protein